MYKTCIFDLYGTLVDIRTDEEKDELWEKMALFYSFYGACYTPSEMKEMYGRIIESMKKGKTGIRRDSHESYPEIQIEQVFLKLFKEKGINADMALAVHAGQFFRVLSMSYIRLYDGTAVMLKKLRESGKKLFLLSNAQRIFTEYEMRALNIFQYFDDIFISSDFDCKKPDIRFFRQLLEKHRIDCRTAIMIGNDGICDVKGAKDAGLAALYVHSNISPDEVVTEADYILHEMDMRKITEILMQ